MRIGIDASRANRRERTGTEWYSYEIIRVLVQQHRDITFTLYLQSDPVDDLRSLGPNVELRVLHWAPGFLWSQFRLSWEMIFRRPDILFIPAHTMPLIHPRRTIVTIHDLGFEHFPELYGRSLIGNRGFVAVTFRVLARLATLGRYGNSELDYHRWSARFAARRATRIITVSNFTKQDLIRRYNATPDRITVVYHGIDHEVFRRPSQEAIDAQRSNFKLARPYVLYIGRLERKKNIEGLIRAFARIRQSLEFDLVLIGNRGLGWDQAEKIIRREKLESAIHEIGWQATSVYVPLLAGARALVFLSNFEGFGMPILEAFAVGTPVVASRAASIPEVAGGAAELVDQHQLTDIERGLTHVLSDPEIAAMLVQRGLERVKGFTWEQAGQATFQALTAHA